MMNNCEICSAAMVRLARPSNGNLAPQEVRLICVRFGSPYPIIINP
jgi:hypothetical protein